MTTTQIIVVVKTVALTVMIGGSVAVGLYAAGVSASMSPSPVGATHSFSDAVTPAPEPTTVEQPADYVLPVQVTGSRFQHAVIEGAKDGNPDAQDMLIKSARRGVKQAQKVCDELGLVWQR